METLSRLIGDARLVLAGETEDEHVDDDAALEILSDLAALPDPAAFMEAHRELVELAGDFAASDPIALDTKAVQQLFRAALAKLEG